MSAARGQRRAAWLLAVVCLLALSNMAQVHAQGERERISRHSPKFHARSARPASARHAPRLVPD